MTTVLIRNNPQDIIRLIINYVTHLEHTKAGRQYIYEVREDGHVFYAANIRPELTDYEKQSIVSILKKFKYG